MERKKILFVDGASMIRKCLFGIPLMEGPEGKSVNGIHGFLSLFFWAKQKEMADSAAVVFPGKEEEILQDFLGQEEILWQIGKTKEVLRFLKVPVLEAADCGLGDLLAGLTDRLWKEDWDTVILTGRKRFLALAGSQCKIILFHTDKGYTEVSHYLPEDVEKEYGVSSEKILDVLAMAGSPEDYLPGIPGIGFQRAAALVGQMGGIENIFGQIDAVTPAYSADILRENQGFIEERKKKLLFVPADRKDFQPDPGWASAPVDREAVRAIKKLGLKSIVSQWLKDSCQEGEQGIWVRTIRTRDEAEEVFASCAQAQVIGLELAGEKDSVLGAALCVGEGQCISLPVSEEIKEEFLLAKIKKLCEGQVPVWMLNLKDALSFLKLTDSACVYDAGVAGYLLNPLAGGYEYNQLAASFLDMTLPSQSELLGKKTLAQALAQDEEKAFAFMGYKAYTAYQCALILPGELKEAGMEKLYLEIERPLIFSLYRMESVGIHVEKEKLKEYGDNLKVQIKQLEQEIYRETGTEFNINSPKQLGEILFDQMKLPYGKKTKTGYSTAADVLEKLAPDYPVVQRILDYRQLAKLNSTYAEGLSAFIKEDGRIHGTFNQTITATGRLSSTEPNLQNIPVRMELGREIRKVFVPKEGCVFIDADYSQIELRILAHMSGDERLIKAYQEAEDIHAITASQVFHTPLDQVTPLQRRNAKAVNFGIVYGISSFGLSEGLSITRKEASQYIDKYFQTYPDVKAFLDRLVEEAKENGYAVSMFGRRRPIPELKSSNFMQRSFGERAAMNSPIQGTAADIIKIAMNRVDRSLTAAGLRSRIVLQVHDELLVEAYREEEEQVKEILVREMKEAAHLKVALEVEAHSGASWFDAK